MINFRHLFVVYRVDVPQLEPHKPFFIGCCPIGEVSDIPDAWRYPTFFHNVKNDLEMSLSSIGLCDTIEAAQALQQSTATVLNVWINLNERPGKHMARGVHSGPKGTPVRNITTGAEYPSAAAAARAMGYSAAAMSKHLAGHIQTLGGQRFEWA